MKGNPRITNMTRKARQYTYAPAAYMSTAASPLATYCCHPNSGTPLGQVASVTPGWNFPPSSVSHTNKKTETDQRGGQAEVKSNSDPSKCCQIYPRTYKCFHGI